MSKSNINLRFNSNLLVLFRKANNNSNSLELLMVVLMLINHLLQLNLLHMGKEFQLQKKLRKELLTLVTWMQIGREEIDQLSQIIKEQLMLLQTQNTNQRQVHNQLLNRVPIKLLELLNKQEEDQEHTLRLTMKQDLILRVETQLSELQEDM